MSDDQLSNQPTVFPLWKQLVFLLMIIAPVLVVAEIMVRLNRLPPGYFPVNKKEDPLYIPDAALGYALKPGAHSDYTTPELDVDIDIGPDGVRDGPLVDARRAHQRVLAVGDSFTMGLAVAQSDTWSEQLERLLQADDQSRAVAVVNGGVAGYSARQIRLRLAQLLPRVEPNVVVFGFVPETFVRMMRPLQLFGGTLVRSDAIPKMRVTETGILYSPYDDPWMRDVDFWLNQHWQLAAHMVARVYGVTRLNEPDDWQRIGLEPEAVRRSMQSSLDELCAADVLARQGGADFVVLLINLQDRGRSFGPRQAVYNEVALRYCMEKGLVCVNPLPELEKAARGQPVFRTPSDQHWTPQAHAIAARTLRDLIRDRTLLDTVRGQPHRPPVDNCH